MRLLAVDDDCFALDLLAGALYGAGYQEFETATSGQGALDLLNRPHTAFDAFLLDIRMPGIDGIELCRRIRAMPRYGSAPILMITAMSDRQYIDGAFAAGAMDYISKPFEAVELAARLGVVERLIAQAKQVAQSYSEVDRLLAQNGQGMVFHTDDPTHIVDVPRVVSLVAMENYLLRLSRMMAYQSESVVFTIEGFAGLKHLASPAEIYDLLTDAAEAIVAGLKRDDHLVTYLGRGQFLAVLHRKSCLHDPETLLAIQAGLDAAVSYLDSGVAFPLTLKMGRIYAPNLLAAGNPLNLLIGAQKARAGVVEKESFLDDERSMMWSA